LSTQQKYDYRSFVRRFVLVGGDTLLIFLSLFIYLKFFHPSGFQSYYSLLDNILWALLIVALWYFYASIFDLYKLSLVDKQTEIIKNTIITATLTGITYIFIPFLSPTLPLNRLPAFLLIGTMVVLLLAWRIIYSVLFKHPILIKKAIIAGAGWTGRELVQTLLLNEQIYHKTAYKIYGFVDDDPEKAGRVYDGVKVLGNATTLLRYATRLKVDEVILAIPEQETMDAKMLGAIIDLENAGIPVRFAYDIYEEQTGKVMVKKKGDNYYLANPYNINQKKRFYMVMNRMINIGWGVLACLSFIILIPGVWVVNLITSRGPLFYHQERVGRNGKKFNILKFRTMIVDAEKSGGPQFASKDDSRITTAGRFLRKARLDELPQFINILKGDMNLIGPRPEREVFIHELSQSIPFFRIRNLVKPGLTGWAQVNHEYTSDTEDALVKLQYDLYYIRHRSLLLDLRIMFKTLPVIFKLKGV
jgi:exopolysaccharide biosynthesis polyprenyl glycosylphosphotransferase